MQVPGLPFRRTDDSVEEDYPAGATSPGDDFYFGPSFEIPEARPEKPNAAKAILFEVMKAAERSLGEERRQRRNLLSRTIRIYEATFLVGVGLLVGAFWKAFSGNGSALDIVATGIFGGVSGAIFLAFFILRPTAALERTSTSNMLLNHVNNCYWARMAYAMVSDDTARNRDRQLEEATADSVQQLTELFKAFVLTEKGYTSLLEREASAQRAAQRPQPDKAATEADSKKNDASNGSDDSGASAVDSPNSRASSTARPQVHETTTALPADAGKPNRSPRQARVKARQAVPDSPSVASRSRRAT